MLKRIFKKLNVKKDKFSDYKKNNINIHPDSFLGYNTTIGFGTNINGPAFIASWKNAPVEIGKYCAIAYGLRIRLRNHHTGYANLQDSFQHQYNFPPLNAIKGPICIGNNVWIADNVTILSGVKIGDGAVLGAGSIVTKDVPPYTIVGGNPAKVIRKRYSDIVIEQMLKVKWWDWSEDRIRRNYNFFSTDFSKLESVDIDGLIVK